MLKLTEKIEGLQGQQRPNEMLTKCPQRLVSYKAYIVIRETSKSANLTIFFFLSFY